MGVDGEAGHQGVDVVVAQRGVAEEPLEDLGLEVLVGHRAGGLQVMGDAAGRRVRLPLCLELIGTDSVQPRQCGQGPPPHVRVQLQSWQGSVQDLSCTSGHLGTARLTEQPRLPCCLQPGAGAHDLGVGSRRGSTEPAPPAGQDGRLPLRGGPGRVIGHEALQEHPPPMRVGIPAGDPQRLVQQDSQGARLGVIVGVRQNGLDEQCCIDNRVADQVVQHRPGQGPRHGVMQGAERAGQA